MFSEGLRWTLAALAAYRLTWEFTFEDGPFCLWDKVRSALGAYTYGPEKIDDEPVPDTALGRWASCRYCLAIFPVPLFILALVYLRWIVTDIALAWIGLAGAVTVLIRITRWRAWKD